LNHAEKILVLAVGLQGCTVALRVDGRLVGKVGLRKATMVLPLRQGVGMNPGKPEIHLGDCVKILPTFAAGSVDAIVTDPPYGLEFMGKEWDKLAMPKAGILGGFADGNKPSFERVKRYLPAMQEWHHQWANAALRVLKPGGYMLCFGGTRSYHRLACAVEDAGFEIRDCIMWIYGSGFPKGKACLKPAYEPILLCRKPGKKVLLLGIDECRIPTDDKLGGGDQSDRTKNKPEGWDRPWMRDAESKAAHAQRVNRNVAHAELLGRWPANIVHDGSEEVLERFAGFGESKSAGGRIGNKDGAYSNLGSRGWNGNHRKGDPGFGDTGTAARFFYCAKASRRERGEGNNHPTVKPLKLVEWLVKLVSRKGELVLDPFYGSGTTGLACLKTGRFIIGIEKNRKYLRIATRRLHFAN
jgi:site-specific DNA-methyltransferase (adenine-specific)